MGIDLNGAWFLLDGKRRGCRYGRMLTVGRQERIASPASLHRLAIEFGFDWPSTDAVESRFADAFLRDMLGATEICCLDASDYEGADILHDLNEPIPTDLEEQFDTVLDGGTIEHVFNAPVAVASYMRLVRAGGSVFIITTANNYFGHGFYQFSSEFFYRVFSDENGFVVKRLVLCEHDPFTDLEAREGRRYDAVDPAAVGGRTPLVNARPLLIMVHAERIRIRPVLVSPPKQSDYEARWGDDVPKRPKSVDSRDAERLGKRLRRKLRRWRKGTQRGLRNAKHFPPAG